MTFALNRDGSMERMTMRAISLLARSSAPKQKERLGRGCNRDVDRSLDE
jgi:hypothetical protein